MIASDRTQENKNFFYDEKLFELERTFQQYPTKDDLAQEMREKVNCSALQEL